MKNARDSISEAIVKVIMKRWMNARIFPTVQDRVTMVHQLVTSSYDKISRFYSIFKTSMNGLTAIRDPGAWQSLIACMTNLSSCSHYDLRSLIAVNIIFLMQIHWLRISNSKWMRKWIIHFLGFEYPFLGRWILEEKKKR